ncbi:hypothetical protein [Vibrio europaeus]|uniref:hypothetical protein n=1 Tax=Vibrio europaeus TaxID=300876 RepID=UPI00233E84DD|nr:hypothetical protein [Vibrio europaeus]MDC5753600.1 hypothetical protein [Vibrio europaeus]MDC5816487.1 hypothetical protein [Vibrio europaeus]
MNTFLPRKSIAIIIADPQVPESFIHPYRSEEEGRSAVVWKAPMGSDLRTIIEKTGKSWSEVGLHCGVNTSTVKKWIAYRGFKEKNKYPVPWLAFKEICLLALENQAKS